MYNWRDGNKNNLRTIEAQIVQKLKNKEARPKFTGSFKRKRVLLPGAPLKNFNDGGGGGGGSDRGSYFIPKKNTTSEFIYPKNHYFS